MRTVPVWFLISLGLCWLPVHAAKAQGLPGDPPAVEPPPVMPEPDDPSMIVPAPDEEEEQAPEAFGSQLPPSEEPIAPQAEADADQTPEQRLDALFAELKQESAEAEARGIVSQIEREWRSSGSATTDLLMLWAAEAMAKSDNAAALDFLDQAVVLDPDHAEAWNRRATLNFSMDRYGNSVSDIEQVLRREPRHFGALLGLAMILERTDRKSEALETYTRVLDIYPALRSAQEAAGRLSEELTGQAI